MTSSDQLKQVVSKTEDAKENIAWCPYCSDSLETKEIWRPDKKYGMIIDHWEYYCFGCNTMFILKEVKPNSSHD